MAKGDEAMPALAAGRIEFELDAAPPGQTAELAQQSVARHRTWMAIDQTRVTTRALADRVRRP
jgi:hypothetical protein